MLRSLFRQRTAWTRRTILAICLAVCAFVAFWISSRAPKPNSGLEVQARDLMLGDIWETENYCHTIEIRNTGRAEILVLDLMSTCGCLSLKPRSFRLKPNESQVVTAVLDLTGKNAETAAAKIRPLSIRIVPKLADGPPAQGWTMQGSVRSAITTAASSLYLGDVTRQPAGITTQAFDFQLGIPRNDIKEIRAICDPALAKVRLNDSGMQDFTLEVTPEHSMPLGDLQFAVLLQVFMKDDSHLTTSKVNVKCAIVDEIQFLPVELSMGQLKIGGVYRDKVVVHSLLGRPFFLQDIHDGKDVTITAKSAKQASLMHSLDVAVRVTNERDQAATVEVLCRNADNEVIRMPLKIAYFGIP